MTYTRSLLDIYIADKKKKEKETKLYDGVERNRDLEKKPLPKKSKKKI